MFKRWQLWLGVIISVVFLYLALRGLDLSMVWYHMRTARYLWIVPGVAVYFFGVWARTWRWSYMLRPIKRIPLVRLFPVVCIGYMGNNIFPARIGEVLRAFVLKGTEEVPVSASLATIVLERIFDGVIMLLFVFVGLPLAPAIPDNWRRFVILFSLLFFGALGLFFIIAAKPQYSRLVYTWIIDHVLPERFREPVRGFADRFMVGLDFLRSPRDVAMIFGTSLVVWLAEAMKYWFVMHAFDFEVSFFVLMLMNGVVNLFTTIPSAPGYLGTFDEPGIEVLKAFGVNGNIAAAYTLVLHAALWLPITALGIWYVWRMSLSWSDLQTAGDVVRSEPEGDPPVQPLDPQD